MKILVSSKALANRLSGIPFSDSVTHVCLDGREFTINTQTKSIKIFVEVLSIKHTVRQDKRNWNHVYNLVNSVQDQPIVLNISEQLIDIIFQY